MHTHHSFAAKFMEANQTQRPSPPLSLVFGRILTKANMLLTTTPQSLYVLETETFWRRLNDTTTADITPNLAAVTNTTTAAVATSSWFSFGRIQIPLYAVILLLALVGNFLVIMTLVQHRRMRTITNVFLLNLAVSDMLLGVLCMPTTLVGALLRDFIFGSVMCRVLPFLQGIRVCVFGCPIK